VPLNPPDGFKGQRKYLSDQIRRLISDRKLSNIFDAILLDEAQDYSADEIAVFKSLGAQLFAVGDGRQQIYKCDEDSPLAAINGAVDHVHSLRYHYRNGREICKLADKIAKDSADYEPLAPTSNYDESANQSKVIIVRGNIDAQCREIVTSLKNQLRVFPNEFLAVVCPLREHVNEIWAKLQENSDLLPKLCKIDDDGDAFDPSKPICVSTIHGVKGLEVRALHLAAAEYVKKLPHQRNVAFTAVTRAKTSLSIYHEDDLKGWFESAVEGMNPQKGPPTFDALFKGKK
jgi:DNA helicase IV